MLSSRWAASGSESPTSGPAAEPAWPCSPAPAAELAPPTAGEPGAGACSTCAVAAWGGKTPSRWATAGSARAGDPEAATPRAAALPADPVADRSAGAGKAMGSRAPRRPPGPWSPSSAPMARVSSGAPLRRSGPAAEPGLFGAPEPGRLRMRRCAMAARPPPGTGAGSPAGPARPGDGSTGAGANTAIPSATPLGWIAERSWTSGARNLGCERVVKRDSKWSVCTVGVIGTSASGITGSARQWSSPS